MCLFPFQSRTRHNSSDFACSAEKTRDTKEVPGLRRRENCLKPPFVAFFKLHFPSFQAGSPNDDWPDKHEFRLVGAKLGLTTSKDPSYAMHSRGRLSCVS
jgi:hypothetical protein